MRVIIYSIFRDTELYFVEIEVSEDHIFRITRSKGGNIHFFTKSELEKYLTQFGALIKMQGVEILRRNGDDYYSED